MKQHFKRSAALFMCLAMLLGIFAGVPMAAVKVSAAETEPTTETATESAVWYDFEDMTAESDLAAAGFTSPADISAWTVSDEDANGGSYSIKVKEGTTGAYLYTPAIPLEDLDYIYAQFDVNANVGVKAYIRFFDYKDRYLNNSYQKSVYDATPNKWVTKSIMLDLASYVALEPAAVTARILFFVPSVPEGKTAYFDNLVIRGVKESDASFFTFDDVMGKAELLASGWSSNDNKYASTANMSVDVVKDADRNSGVLKLVNNTSDLGVLYTPYIPVTAGQTITISADIKTSSTVYLDGAYYDADMNFVSYIGGSNKIQANGNGAWTAYRKTFTVPTGVSYLSLMPYILANAGEVCFDNIIVGVKSAVADVYNIPVVDSLHHDFSTNTSADDVWSDGFVRATALDYDHLMDRMSIGVGASSATTRSGIMLAPAWTVDSNGDGKLDATSKQIGFATPAVKIGGAETLTFSMDYVRRGGGIQIYMYFLDAAGNQINAEGKTFSAFANLGSVKSWTLHTYSTGELTVPENAEYFYAMVHKLDGDYACIYSVDVDTTHTCADGDNDHNCDICGAELSTCADGDNDHNCDVCGTELSTCADGDNDHNCDVCGAELTTCADTDNDHICNTCGATISTCADGDNDHNCDVCGTELTSCADTDDDHVCNTCGATTSTCADGDNDHNCDVCGTELSTCADGDNDHNCDVCGTELSTCADGDNDHNCDVCGDKLSDCADADDHLCDVCGDKLSDCTDTDGDSKCDVCGASLGSVVVEEKVVELNSATLNVATGGYKSGTYTIDNITYGYNNIYRASASSAILQINKKSPASAVFNNTAMPGVITKIELNYAASKDVSAKSNAMKVTFGSAANPTGNEQFVSLVAGTYTYTVVPTDATNTFFAVTYNASSGALYWDSIKVYYEVKNSEECDHNWQDATCTAPKTCTECGTTEGEALGHTEEIIPGIAATCTATGLTEGKKCSVCDEILVAQTVIAKTAHIWDETVSPKTCTECGTVYVPITSATITFDSTSKRTEYDTEHQVWREGELVVTNNKGESTTNVADYADPVRLYKNSELIVSCGQPLTKIEFTCSGADYAADLAASITTGTVTVDGMVVTVVFDEAVDSFAVTLTEGQVRLNALTVHCAEPECSHVEETIPGYAATCTATGLTDGVKCSVCGEILTAQVEIPALGHDYEAVVTAPTCTAGGYTTYTCACGDSYVADQTAAKGHKASSVEVVSATCTVDGYLLVTCNACGETFDSREEGFAKDYLEEMSWIFNVTAKGHTEEIIPGKDATCDETGLTDGVKCSVCGEILTAQVEIPALGHTAGAATKENWVSPSNTADGSYDKVVRCTVCGETISSEHVVVRMPNATVTVKDSMVLTPEEHDYMCWPSGDATIDRPLQIVMNFKANDTLEEALAGEFSKYLCDFYLTITGLETGSITADNCYLAGNYGTFGWIVIPTDGMVLEEGVCYPVVSAYDATLNYKDICKSVKDFTAAIYVDQAILDANPNFEIKLELKMTNPENADDVIVVGEPAVYDVEDLEAGMPVYVAQNGEKQYTSLQTAIDKATAGDTIDLLAHIESDVSIVINKSITLNLNGYSITRTTVSDAAPAILINGTDVNAVITGEGDVTAYGPAVWAYNGNVTIEGGNYVSKDSATIYAMNASHVVINGGKFTSNCEGSYWALNIYDASRETASITVNGGEFVNFNPYNNVAEGANTNFVATGKHALDADGDGIYTIDVHSYESSVTDPTCTEQGYTTYTCSCGDSYVTDYVDAVGHSWTPATTEAPKTCTVCGATEGDPLPAGPQLDTNLTFANKAMQLGASINAQFLINLNVTSDAGYSDVYVMVKMGDKETKLDVDINPYNSFAFAYPIPAYEMGTEMEITAYATKDGVEVKGATETWSVREGLIDILDRDYEAAQNDEALMKRCVMAVEMLYYGAAAQASFRPEATPVTNDLDSRYVALHNTEDPSITAENTPAGSGANALIAYALSAQEKVYMQFVFMTPDTNHSAYTIKVTRADGSVKEFAGEDLYIPYPDGNLVAAIYEELGAMYMRETVTVELYHNGDLVSATYSASIEGCAKIQLDGNRNVELNKAMIKFGDAAKAVFG